MKIFNASPLILILGEINEPDIIEKLSSLDPDLFIPKKVNEEIKSDLSRENLNNFLKSGILKILENESTEDFQTLKNRFPTIDDGELSVMSAVYHSNGSVAIIDEKKGRNACNKLNINVIGAFNILVELYNLGIIDKQRLCSTCRKIDKSAFRINFKKLGYEWVLK
ncbi:MAG: hypothetical protein GON13_02360 [Nanoarchaeota archaeon]|nr:hypothetical protein [Nanoarchaeota archaeon]